MVMTTWQAIVAICQIITNLAIMFICIVFVLVMWRRFRDGK